MRGVQWRGALDIAADGRAKASADRGALLLQGMSGRQKFQYDV